MILSLSIRDFVLIDRLDIEPGAGFTALTGRPGRASPSFSMPCRLRWGMGPTVR